MMVDMAVLYLHFKYCYQLILTFDIAMVQLTLKLTIRDLGTCNPLIHHEMDYSAKMHYGAVWSVCPSVTLVAQDHIGWKS